MIRRPALAAGFALLVAACSARSENADSTSVLTIDTLKPATVALPATDSAPADTIASTKTAPTTKSKSAATKTKQGDTKELGRDSIIRFDTKDKRRQLPPADTSRKP